MRLCVFPLQCLIGSLSLFGLQMIALKLCECENMHAAITSATHFGHVGTSSRCGACVTKVNIFLKINIKKVYLIKY